MIWPFQDKIQFTLCSQSPRRREIFEHHLRVSHLRTKVVHKEDSIKERPETWNRDVIIQYNESMALHKAKSVEFDEQCFQQKGILAECIIGADSIVVSKDYGTVMEKPKNRAHAKSMLEKLCQERQHSVFTAVSYRIKTKSGQVYEKTFSEETKVTFSALDSEQIEAYLDLNDWTDKAGGYGIQSVGSSIVERIEGTQYNVMGFPVNAFARQLLFMKDVLRNEAA